MSKAVAVIGPRASGKMSVSLIKSLVFIDWFINHSFHARSDEPVALAPHFSDAGLPSTFEIEFEWSNQLGRRTHRIDPSVSVNLR